MSIMEYNGGSVVAMTGKECVAIASDLRFGQRISTVACNFTKVFEMGEKLYVGLPGLTTDTLTVHDKLKFRQNLYELRENRKMKPQTFTNMLANFLYEKRFGPYFINPVIAGLDPKTNVPYVANMDLIGCITEPRDFVVAGTAEEQLFGMCETVWEPDMSPEQLFEAISQAMMNACDRDAGSGWGIVVHVIEKDKVTKRLLKSRMD